MASSKISKATTWIMISSAILVDLIQLGVNFIPEVGQVINRFITIVAYFIFYLWFILLGVNVFTKYSIVCYAVEFIPILDALPTFTAMVVKRISDVKGQEALQKMPLLNTAISIKKMSDARGIKTNKEIINTEKLSGGSRERLFNK